MQLDRPAVFQIAGAFPWCICEEHGKICENLSVRARVRIRRIIADHKEVRALKQSGIYMGDGKLHIYLDS